MSPRLVAPPASVRSIASLLEDVREGRLLRPRAARGFVWTPSNVVELWTTLAAGHPVGSLLVRDEAPISALEPISLPVERSVAPSSNPCSDASVAIYDGLNRLAALSMTAHGCSVRVGHTDERIAWRVAYDPFVGDFHCSATPMTSYAPTVVPDLRVLFQTDSEAALEHVIRSHLGAVWRSETRADTAYSATDYRQATERLRHVRGIFDDTTIIVETMPAGATDEEALTAMCFANGLRPQHSARP